MGTGRRMRMTRSVCGRRVPIGWGLGPGAQSGAIGGGSAARRQGVSCVHVVAWFVRLSGTQHMHVRCLVDSLSVSCTRGQALTVYLCLNEARAMGSTVTE